MLLWLEGFDWLQATTHLVERYSGATSVGSLGAPAFGLDGISAVGPFTFTTPPLISNPGTTEGDDICVLGYHGRHFASSANQVVATIQNAGQTKIAVRVQRRDNSAGDYDLVYEDFDGATLARVGPFIYGTWYYFEHEIVLDAAVGSIKTWIDGYLLDSATNLDTTTGLGAAWDRALIDFPASSALDNLYLADGRVSNSPVDTVAGVFGPMVVEALVPDTVDGDWVIGPTPVAALSTLDGDLSFVESTVVGQRMNVTFEPALYSQGGRIAGFQFTAFSKASGSPGGADVLVNDTLLDTITGNPTVYVAQEALNTANPNNSLPWRPEDLDLTLSFVST